MAVKEVKAVEPGPVLDAKVLFSDEELKELQKRAAQEFRDEEKKKLADAFVQEEKAKIRQKALFAAGKDAQGQEIESLTIDLAPHAPYISIDGKMFFHGVTYKFTKAQVPTVREIMHRTWVHEAETGGANLNLRSGAYNVHTLSGKEMSNAG